MSLDATQQKFLLLSEGSSDADSKLLFGFVLPAPRRVSLIDVVFLILERLRVRLVFARQLISSIVIIIKPTSRSKSSNSRSTV